MKLRLLSCFLFLASFCNAQSFEIYVSDAGNFNNPPWQILRFDEDGTNPTVFIDTNLNWPQDILFLEDSNTVLISNLGSGKITRHDAATGAYIDDFASLISGPTRIKIGKDSLLYVLQWSGDGKVLRYQLDGTYVDAFTSTGVPQSIGMDWDSVGNLYVSSYNGDLVKKFDTAGVDQGVFISTNLSGPTNIWFDTTGELLVADYDGTAVKRFSSTGTYVSDFITGLSKCEGVAMFPNGDILIGNGSTKSVKLFDSTGAYISDLIPSGSGSLLTPNAVVLRETSTTSIREKPAAPASFIYPTTGTEFFLNPDFEQEVTSIEVYNLSGKLIKKVRSPDQLSWHADNHPEGMYLIKIISNDQTATIQKVIVSR